MCFFLRFPAKKCFTQQLTVTQLSLHQHKPADQAFLTDFYLQKIGCVRNPEEIQRHNIEALINLRLAQTPVIALHIHHSNLSPDFLGRVKIQE